MIPVKVDNLTLSNVGFVVLLKGDRDERTLPIYIGPPEAQAILFEINDVSVPRPLTHDLLKNVVSLLGGRLDRVLVCDLRDETFYATLRFEVNDTFVELDSRPSDSIALALRCGAPIFVEESVMDRAGVVIDESSADEDGDSEGSEPAEMSDPRQAKVAMLNKKLEAAVAEERYEEAARLRDEISEVTRSMLG